MGCVSCSLGSIISITLDALERITLSTVCAMLTCCLMLTLMAVMIMGVGVGYHYCYVSHAVDAMAKAANSSGGSSTEGLGLVMRSLDKAVKRSVVHRLARREVQGPSLNNTEDLYSQTSMNTTKLFDLLAVNKTLL